MEKIYLKVIETKITREKLLKNDMEPDYCKIISRKDISNRELQEFYKPTLKLLSLVFEKVNDDKKHTLN